MSVGERTIEDSRRLTTESGQVGTEYGTCRRSQVDQSPRGIVSRLHDDIGDGSGKAFALVFPRCGAGDSEASKKGEESWFGRGDHSGCWKYGMSIFSCREDVGD